MLDAIWHSGVTTDANCDIMHLPLSTKLYFYCKKENNNK